MGVCVLRKAQKRQSAAKQACNSCTLEEVKHVFDSCDECNVAVALS